MKKKRRIRWDRLMLVIISFSFIVASITFGIIKLLDIQKQNRENIKVNVIVDGTMHELNAEEFVDFKQTNTLPSSDVVTLQYVEYDGLTKEEWDNDMARQEYASKHVDEAQADNDNTTYLGEFKLTGYCNCEICCGQWAGGPTYSGVMPQSQHTIAVDKDIIPIGSHVLINGIEYVAEDTGSAIIGNRIDVYCDTHEECYGDFCNGYADVYLIND